MATAYIACSTNGVDIHRGVDAIYLDLGPTTFQMTPGSISWSKKASLCETIISFAMIPTSIHKVLE